MQNVKNELNKYLNNQITIEELNRYFMQNVPFMENSVIEDIRLEADLTIEGELTEQDKADELIDEKTFKKNLKKYLEQI